MNAKTDTMAREIVEALRSVAPNGGLLHAPTLEGNAWAYVKKCLDTGWVSTAGAFVERFEAMLCEVTGAAHAITTVNGTAALHAGLMLAGVGPEDEVIVPALSFVAPANAVAYVGAVPHFADCEERTMGIDPARLASYLEEIAEPRDGGCLNRRTGRRIAALICVHVFGHPADLDALSEVCARFGITLIEDAAESLGTLYKGRHTGCDGLLAALSFNGNKIATTGGGGAILTDDAALADEARHMTTTAKLPHAWEFDFDRIGYNYRLPNINAALGCAQLECLEAFVARKRALAEAYRRAFAGVAGVRVFEEPDFARGNYWLNVILIDRDRASAKDAVLETLNQAGFQSRPAWKPLHRLPMFAECPRMELPLAEDLYARLINIPSGAGLKVN